MNNLFIKRLINNALSKESPVSIKPTITPDAIPEIFHMPEHQYPFALLKSPVQSGLTPPSTPEPSISEKQLGQEATPRQKELTISSKGVNDTKSSRIVASKKKDNHTQDISTSNIKQAESEATNKKSFIPQAQESFAVKIEKKEQKAKIPNSKPKGLPSPNHPSKEKRKELIRESNKREIPIESKVVNITSKDPAQVPAFEEAEKSLTDYTKERRTEERLQDKAHGIIHRHTPLLETPQESQKEVVTPKRLIKQTKFRPSSVSHKEYRLIPTRRRIDKPQQYSEPIVDIHIGRIEVRAVMQQKSTAKTSTPILSLRDYLNQRSEGDR